MSPEIEPLYWDMDAFNHRIVGFAYTMRLLPTNCRRNLPNELEFEPVTEWRNELYAEKAMFPHERVSEETRDHDVIICASYEIPTAVFGSMNTLDLFVEGAAGLVTDGGPRNTDAVTKQGAPV